MLVILLLVLVGIGITNLIVNASVLEKFRLFISQRSVLFGELINCMLCSGFWVGFGLGLIEHISPIYLGALVSLLSFVFGKLIDYCDLQIAIKAKELENEDGENK